jgi:hypothetical protein
MERFLIKRLIYDHLPVKIRRLPDLLESALRFQHHPTIPVRPCHHGKFGVFYPFILKPFIMPEECLTKSNTSVHLEPHRNTRIR